MCFISVIIPTYNAGKTICKCLSTLLQQSFDDFEILIQDGGSTDNTLELVSHFKDKRIKVLSADDKGVYDAMNKAVSRSKGKWLYFLGSDDSLFSNKIFDIISASLRDSLSEVLYGDVKLLGNDGVIVGDSNGIYRGFTPAWELIFDNICHQAIFYKSNIFKEDRFRYELKYNVQADHVLNIKLASLYSFQYVPVVIANFQHGGMSTQLMDSYFSQDIGKILLEYYGFKLSNKRFYKSKNYIKNEARKLLKTGRLSSGIKGYLIYLLLKTNYNLKVK
ncbi:glycosyltransferase family 2 protein [Sphingobacterium faecium]|uniref:glycosyltransferase family 2 protein n=1 Tax=Sphingobacterium faecium TaxID=34087 RepID=UPI00320B2429